MSQSLLPTAHLQSSTGTQLDAVAHSYDNGSSVVSGSQTGNGSLGDLKLSPHAGPDQAVSRGPDMRVVGIRKGAVLGAGSSGSMVPGRPVGKSPELLGQQRRSGGSASAFRPGSGLGASIIAVADPQAMVKASAAQHPAGGESMPKPIPRSHSDPHLPSAAALAASSSSMTGGGSRSRFGSFLGSLRPRTSELVGGVEIEAGPETKRRRVGGHDVSLGARIESTNSMPADSLAAGVLADHPWMHEESSAGGLSRLQTHDALGGSRFGLSIELRRGQPLAEIVLRSRGAAPGNGADSL